MIRTRQEVWHHIRTHTVKHIFLNRDIFGLCISGVCVRACTNPRVCARVRVRAGGGSEQSRTVQQAQAAGRAGEAAKKYSSRYLKLRGEQRSVRTSACTVRTEPPNPPCSFSHTLTGALDACWYLFYFILFFFYIYFSPPHLFCLFSSISPSGERTLLGARQKIRAV